MIAQKRLFPLLDNESILSPELTQSPSEGRRDKYGRRIRKFPEITPSEWAWAAIFLIFQPAIGLGFKFLLPFVLVMLIVALKQKPYDFLIMLQIVTIGYSMGPGFRKIALAAMIASVVGLLVLRLPPVAKRVAWVLIIYAGFLIWFASMSRESMDIQLPRIRSYIIPICFIVPLLVFANRNFDIQEFFRKLVPYIIILAIFYFLDSVIFSGWVMYPFGNFSAWDSETEIGMANLYWAPLSFQFPRVGPNGMVFMALFIYPLAKYYKFKPWEWFFIIAAIIIVRTMTVLFGMIIAYVFFRMKGRQLLKVLVGAIIAIPLFYFIDSSTGDFLRFSSTIDQFTSLHANMDDEELREFGSGRMAQIIPKFEALHAQKRQWIGFGFLDPQKSKAHDFMINNSLYYDRDEEGGKDEVVTNVEVTQLQTILDIGYLGLIIQTIVYILIYFIIRKLKYSGYYLCTLIAVWLFGIGGMGGLNGGTTLWSLATILGVIILANRPRRQSRLETALSTYN